MYRIQLTTSARALIAHHYMLRSRSTAGRRGRLGNSATLVFSDKKKKKVFCCTEPEVTASWILIANNDCFGILSQSSEHSDCISIELLPAIFAAILHSPAHDADDKGVNHLFTVVSVLSTSVLFLDVTGHSL